MPRLGKLRFFASAGCLLIGALAGMPAARVAASSSVGADAAACGGVLSSHAPVAIKTDADWAPAGASGSGTVDDPYVLGCLQISVPAQGTGIDVAASATKAFVIRNVEVSGPNGGNSVGIFIHGAAGGGRIERSTFTSLTSGIIPGGSGQLAITANAFDGNHGAVNSNTNQNITIDGNVGQGNDNCISIALLGTNSGQVTNNSCSGGTGIGYTLSGTNILATGNSASGSSGIGFEVGGATVRGNIAQGNGEGFLVTSGTLDQNSIVNNRGNGIDLEAGQNDSATITNNVIEHNGGSGISGDPANANFFFGFSSHIIGNHIGNNGNGIIFFGPSEFGNLVANTDWTDGEQSISNFGYLNSIVDAGSDKVGSTGAPVSFNDYLATVSLGPTTSPVSFTNPAHAYVQTSIAWNFGDGSPVQTTLDPSQGHGSPPAFSHRYQVGEYSATLTVTGMDQGGQPFTYTDTVPVSIS